MTNSSTVQRLTAFSEDPAGGNPAGVWIGDGLPVPAQMQRIAAEVGYSETAFIAPQSGRDRQIRYFSPLAEVPFCGHATIASGVALGRSDGLGEYRLQTTVGEIPVQVTERDDRIIATLTSVDTHHKNVPAAVLADALDALDWHAEELDTRIPPALAYAGAWHLVIAAATQERLSNLDYDFDALKTLMLAHELTTLQLVWRADLKHFHARNPFPVGGVVEDAATGAAAAALGGYLRDSGLVTAPFDFEIRQGEAMGRPSRLLVAMGVKGGVAVTGTATDIPNA
ncbi:MAG: PhzF family phenazine biosynthesis protein [Gammaproteobacteria bacterium]